ncbi:hypothetical protein FACS1894176_11430 [Bacteroidia bacterium]|nr:hypothetical protein FACS1894176_11430 [Bacteroidia bacterium]
MSKSAVTIGLDFLSRELKKAKLCDNTKPIVDAINDLKNRKDPAGYWGYNVQKLVFNKIDTPRGTMPNNIKSIQIALSVEIHEQGFKNNEIYNPIIVDFRKGIEKNYNFSIEISGYSEQNKVISHWHLDFDGNEKNEYIHPDFHLTFGGNAMKADGEDENQAFGKVLILPSPRLPYPPMDAILGIDFIIQNFVQKSVVSNLINNSQYKQAVKSSQERLWRPYMLALANHWCAFKYCRHFDTDNSLSNKYYPTLIK